MTNQPYMSGKDNEAIVAALQNVLADTFVLYFKTHSFHWNVEGPHFQQLHTLFEEQYDALWTATDDIAERIRALGSYAPISYKDILGKASLSETGQMPDADGMLQMLEKDNHSIVKTLYAAIEAAQEGGDEGTADMMIARSQEHEKAAWMLASLQKR